MKKYFNNAVFVSMIIVFLLFLFFFLILNPIMNSDDDFYFLYALAGGYGSQPSNLLHYNYAWNPIITWPIANLFKLFPGFNWYSFVLVVFHFISCFNLLYVLLIMHKKRLFAIVVFMAFFLFFESRLLLSLNYSNTSFTLAISGCSSIILFHLPNNNGYSSSSKPLFIALLLVLLSGLLRVHAMGLCVLLTFWVGLLLIPFSHFWLFLKRLAITGVILFLLIKGHQSYYLQHIPNYKAEEKLRQSFFYLANRPLKKLYSDSGILKIKASFLQNCFLYDSSFLSNSDITTVIKKTTPNQPGGFKKYTEVAYWFFMESRVYLLLLGIIFLTFVFLKAYGILWKWLFILFPGIIFLVYLMFFMKVTEGIFIAVFSLFFLSAVFCSRSEQLKRSNSLVFNLLLFGFGFVWMLIRVREINQSNVRMIRQTRCVLNELNDFKEYLFVASDLNFPDNGFYCWDVPQKYPLKNLINKELLITNDYWQILNHFKIHDLLESMAVNDNIFFLGHELPELKTYFLYTKHLNIYFTRPSGFNCLNAYQMKVKPN